MSFTSIVLTFIVIVNGIFVIQFVLDLIKHKQDLKREPKKDLLLAISSPIIFFFSSFGVSDFAISTVFYRKMKLIKDAVLPGTLNTQGSIPFAAMALFYISIIQVDKLTLVVCIIAQVIGAYFGPRYVVKFSEKVIRTVIGFGLVIATLFILAGKFHFIPSGGMAVGLTSFKLVIAAVCLFVFGALNNIGIGCFGPTMVTVYALGMSPAVAFPIMMGSTALSVPVGSMQFIKYQKYDRKITLFTSTIGLLGVILGVYFVHALDISKLQWIVAFVLLYGGLNMLINEFKNKKDVHQNPTR